MSRNWDKIYEEFLRLGHLAAWAEELEEEEESRIKRRRIWVKEWVSRRQIHVPLFKEIQHEDREKFLSNFRLYPEEFDQLLSR